MRGLASILLASALIVPGTAWASSGERDETITSMPDSAWPDSITELSEEITQLSESTTTLDTNISPLEEQSTEAGETVISLSSDILFAFDKADIGKAATQKIRELAADVPDGEQVQIGGHTDALGTGERNAELSLERAEAVAAVITKERPDLELEVEGFGPDQPVEPNEVGGEDNPQGRAKNRRVEIRYEG